MNEEMEARAVNAEPWGIAARHAAAFSFSFRREGRGKRGTWPQIRALRAAPVPLCDFGQERPYLGGLHWHVRVVQQAIKLRKPPGVFGVRQFALPVPRTMSPREQILVAGGEAIHWKLSRGRGSSVGADPDIEG
jgi:hypothetical protein